jgi:uncharacterized protein (DUF2062 family)
MAVGGGSEKEGLVRHSFFRRKIVKPLADLMRQGVTPEKIAISISLGVALGVFPVLGTTTVLCVLAAVALGLNLPAIQLVNYLVYPLQLALLVPFMQLGGWLFGSGPTGLSLAEVASLVRTDLRQVIVILWSSTLHAIGAWLILAPPLVLVLNRVLCGVLRRISISTSRRQPAAGDVQ